ncbi:MAG: gamma-glutamylcyclotransferase family protein [Nitrospinales bacterium]
MQDWLNFFAYDDLMNLEVMKEHGLEYRAFFSVTLSSFKVVFNKIPVDNGGYEEMGLPNIIPIHDNLGSIEGVLYEINESFLPKLDEIYGHPTEYKRQVFRFTKHDFTVVKGFTYVAVPERTKPKLSPNKALMKRIKGSKKNLQTLYFYRLMNVRTVD